MEIHCPSELQLRVGEIATILRQRQRGSMFQGFSVVNVVFQGDSSKLGVLTSISQAATWNARRCCHNNIICCCFVQTIWKCQQQSVPIVGCQYNCLGFLILRATQYGFVMQLVTGSWSSPSFSVHLIFGRLSVGSSFAGYEHTRMPEPSSLHKLREGG